MPRLCTICHHPDRSAIDKRSQRWPESSSPSIFKAQPELALVDHEERVDSRRLRKGGTPPASEPAYWLRA